MKIPHTKIVQGEQSHLVLEFFCFIYLVWQSRETLALRMKGPNKPLGDVVEGLPRPTIDIVAFPGDQKLDPPCGGRRGGDCDD